MDLQSVLIDAIYATIRAPESWPDLLERLCAWLDAASAIMVAPSLPGAPPVPLFVYGLDVTPILANYPKHAGRAEFTLRALATGRVPGAFLLDELMPPHERATNAFWQDMVAPLGFASGIFGMVRTPEDNERPVLLNFYRRADQPAYMPADVARLEALFPHLRRALGVALDAPAHQNLPPGVADLYDAIGAPCFLIGADGACAHKNHAADLMLKAKDGVALVRRRLRLTDAGAQAQLDEVFARIVDGAWSGKYRVGAEILANRPSGGPAMVLVVTPLGVENPIAALATPVRCAVFVLEEKLRANGVLPDRLRRLYGLTPAETDIVIALAGGQSVAQIAKARGTAAETVRSQVKSALGKTGARRQADLVALVNRLRF